MTGSTPHEKPDSPEKVGLPATPFLYHLDQVATLLGYDLVTLIDTKIYFLGRSGGRNHPRQIRAVNIATNENHPAEWRVSEGEFVRWLKLMGLRVYSRGRVV